MFISHPDPVPALPPLSVIARAFDAPDHLRALQDEFDSLSETFAASGGMFSADVLAARSELRSGNGVGIVARWIVSRCVVSVHWLGAYWIPAFQFSARPLQVQDCVADVLVELCPVMDDWCLAQWFASANGWLAGACPADALKTTPRDVWQAARAQRFAISG